MRLYNAANLTKYDDSCHADIKMRAHPQKIRRKVSVHAPNVRKWGHD